MSGLAVRTQLLAALLPLLSTPASSGQRVDLSGAWRQQLLPAIPGSPHACVRMRAQAPDQLQALFQANLPLLLSIFNPEGWLDVTYLDAHHRVGRDDKGNVFLLQRRGAQQQEQGRRENAEGAAASNGSPALNGSAPAASGAE